MIAINATFQWISIFVFLFLYTSNTEKKFWLVQIAYDDGYSYTITIYFQQKSCTLPQLLHGKLMILISLGRRTSKYRKRMLIFPRSRNHQIPQCFMIFPILLKCTRVIKDVILIRSMSLQWNNTGLLKCANEDISLFL